MSALNKPGNGNAAVGYEFVKGVMTPQTTGTLRGQLPSYTDTFLHVTQAETVQIVLQVPALTGGTTTPVSATQGLEALRAIQMAGTDIGQMLFTNVSAVPSDPNYVVGHPTLNVQIGAGDKTLGDGTLQAGFDYSAMQLYAEANIFTAVSTAAGTVTIRATALMIGATSS